MSLAARKSPPTSPLSKATIRSRSPPLAPLPSLSTTIPGLTAFDRAVHIVNVSNTGQGFNDGQTATGDRVVITPEEQLLLYGAYKQACNGDIKGPKPVFYDIPARSKWQAWSNMSGKTSEQARDAYVDLVVKSLTKPGSHPDHYALADEILQRPPSPPPSFPRTASSNIDKELPPIRADAESTPSMLPNTSSSTSYQQQHTRKDSSGHSFQSTVTGGLPSAPSIYELASETFPDGEPWGQSIASVGNTSADNTDPGYHEITETVVEEEVLDDDEYAAEVQRATASLSPPSTAKEYVYARNQTSRQGQDEDEDEDDEVYQSSVEHDEDDGDNGNNHSQGSQRSSSETKRERPFARPHDTETAPDSLSQRRQDDRDDFVDEGVFDEEEKDEQDAEVEGLLHSPETVADVILEDREGDSQSDILAQPKTSWDESVSSGYGGSALSDKEAISHRALDSALGQTGDFKQDRQLSPAIVPYRVSALYDVNDPLLPLHQHTEDIDRDEKRAINPDAAEAATLDTSPVSSAPLPSITSISAGEPVCPVSKKTASSGGVCPAAMFAQARAEAAAKEGEESKSGSATAITATTHVNSNNYRQHDSMKGADSASSIPTKEQHWRSMTEPSAASTPSTVTSAVTAATGQGKRIGQGIVSRFSALRSSLAAASFRATSLALSGGSTSSSSAAANPNAVVVRDPVTNQSVTVVCPHLVSTQVLETEMVRLQTDISVLHERLDLLQQSLHVKFQTRELERRSARGIIKMVLRQGLINAVLLLIVFAVLYKRKSPIAFAILAYIGQGRREGEAGWRAFMRWCAGLVRTGQRNQMYVLQAGRRNGFW